MDIFDRRYAEAILRYALRLESGDVLSINTEEENSAFAHDIAELAKEITGNGTFIQTIENGKVVSGEEACTDYPIDRKPTALLYIPVYQEYDQIDGERALTVPEIQRFRHLADPLDNPLPSIAFAAAPVPSDAWGMMIDSDGGREIPASFISSLLSLEDDDFIAHLKENEDLLIYERNELNRLRLTKCHIEDENGTDITFSFLKDSVFATTVTELASGRRFVPTVFSSDIFRALDPFSAEGYITSSRPFMLFGKTAGSFSASFCDGAMTDFSMNENDAELMNLYLSLDQNGKRLSELSLSEISSEASDIDYMALPEWDRMRTVSLTMGGPRPESLRDGGSGANDSITSLSIPVGTDSTTITCTDENGEEFVIMDDGFIRDDF